MSHGKASHGPETGADTRPFPEAQWECILQIHGL